MSSKQWHGGKGSQRRGDDSKSNEQYRSNWDRIFGGIDYNSLDKTQYHSQKEGVSLSPGKNSSAILPDPLSTKQINNNGENK